MKYLILLFMIPLFASAQADYNSVDDSKWLTNYDSAISKAKKQKKNVLVYFTGSDWCPPCKMLKTDLFDTNEFQELSNNYILLYIDVPRNRDLISEKQMIHNKELLTKLNKKKVFPMFKIIDAKGKELDKLSGYSMNGVIDSHLRLLEKNK
ncbi:thioredoxin family protein [Maribacter sp. SA7]|uniref:thioredoxin family protein n=1 Tax=Maribacter zhoushanensis TaxID=3030012 RepID=UPI0023ECA0AD|nr:thioredoxin family protein [Maribacter zhoushanensis]MDF4204060.1 thioredoxin family protein [Maribacter zhoushanensis]